MGLAGHVARITESRVHTGVLVVKLMGASPLVRPTLRLESNSTTDLEEMGLGLDCVMCLRIVTGGGLLWMH